MPLFTREELEKMSEEELERIYQEKNASYDKTEAKNRRIHGMLVKRLVKSKKLLIPSRSKSRSY
ncbi:MAG: hypothetical protein ACFE9L_08985 [Candidatus Hodarchaeota archaeon]